VFLPFRETSTDFFRLRREKTRFGFFLVFENPAQPFATRREFERPFANDER